MPMATAVVGRQPIVDRDRTIVGFELLFRSVEQSRSAYDLGPNTTPGVALDGNAMSATVIADTLTMGIERVVGSKTMFCNADRRILTGRVELALPAEQTVVEVLETVTIDDDILAGCRALRAQGYRLAADDFRWFDGAERLLELVDIVKVDLRQTTGHDLSELIDRCRRFDVELLAEKVETEAELTSCLGMGFSLFQGYFFGRPSVISDPSLAPSKVGVIRLATALMDDDADFATVEQIVRTEPALSYRLMQLAAIGRLGETRRNIRTVHEALITVGLARLRGWLPVLLLRPPGSAIDSSLPSVLSRARMAELIAERLAPAESGFAFAAGMLSAFDLLLGVPADEVPDRLTLPRDLRDAAFGGMMGIGPLITAVTNYQVHGTVPDLDGIDGIDEAIIDEIAAQAFSWAVTMSEQMDTAPVPSSSPRA